MASNDMNFTISTAECLQSYDKYVKNHLERPKNQKLSFETVIEILQDRGVFVRQQPPVFFEVGNLHINPLKQFTFLLSYNRTIFILFPLLK